MTQISTIPVIDFRLAQTNRGQFVESVGSALRDVGFFSLVHHGLPTESLARVYETMDQFFQLPNEAKMRYDSAEHDNRVGFTRFGQEHAKDCEAPDLKEFFQILPEDHPSIANVWPDAELPTFRPVMTDLFSRLELCAKELLHACALYIGEKETLFSDMLPGSNTLLRLLHYPPIPDDVNPTSVRAAAHEDINLITLLCAATAAGLEIQEKDGSWLAVPSIPDQIIVDSADMLQQITNGYFKATTHRVVNPDNSRERRYSVPFFVHPRSDVRLDPLPSCVALTGGKAVYPNRTAGEYLYQRLAEIGL